MKYPKLISPTGEYDCIFNGAYNIHKTGQSITEDNGYQNLTFNIAYDDPNFGNLINEMDIECDGDVYTIKKIEHSKYETDVAEITCDALWYKLADGEYKGHDSSKYFTAKEAVDEQLAGTGWSLDDCDIEITHAFSLEENSILANLRAIRDLYGGEMWFNTNEKKVIYKKDLGKNTDNLLSYSRNLNGIKKTVDTTELYTRFTLVGKDGVKLSGISGKLDYVENYAYYDRLGIPRVIRHYTKQDERFYNAFNMEEYMNAWIAIHGEPKVTYEVDAACLTEIPNPGDYVYVIDKELKIQGWMKVMELDIDVLDTLNSKITLNNVIRELSDALSEAESRINAAVNITMSSYTTREELTSAIEQTEKSVKLYADQKFTTHEDVSKVVEESQVGLENFVLDSRFKLWHKWLILQGEYKVADDGVYVWPTQDKGWLRHTAEPFGHGEGQYVVSFYAKVPDDINKDSITIKVGQWDNLTEVTVNGHELSRYHFVLDKSKAYEDSDSFHNELVFEFYDKIFLTKVMVNKGNTLIDFKAAQSEIEATVLEVSNSTIIDTKVEYAQSDSNTVAPTSGWSTQSPQWEKGKYIWQRIITTYGNGTVNTSEATCISGADGTGVESIVTYYYKSSSATSLKDGEWTTEPPTWENGYYVWTKTRFNYTNGAYKDTDPICVSGSQGATGPAGATGPRGESGVSLVKSYMEFAGSNSDTVEPTSGWSQTPPSWADFKHIWQRAVSEFSDGSRNTSKAVCLSGLKGDKGVGVSEITEYYLATASSTGVTTKTSGWTTTIQNTDPTKKYLWNYEVIKYTDNSSQTGTPKIIGMYSKDGNNGNDGNDGRGIRSITNYYLATSSYSGVTSSTSGWTTTVQSVTSTKKYLWNYEEVNYTDNTSTPTTPCIIGVYGDKGEKGNKGDKGDSGVGVSKIEEYYLASSSNSGVTTSTGGWTTTVQNTDETKKYLWNYEKITYTNNSTQNGTPKIIGMFSKDGTNGTNGTNGTDGKGIKSVTNYYLATASYSGVTTSTSGWSTTVQSVSPSKKYLWNYEVITYTDNSTTTTTPCIIGAYGDTGSKGDKGDKGDKGVGVNNIVTQYYLSTSGTELVGGEWTLDMPAIAENHYLWMRTKLSWTDGTVTYSDPVLCDTLNAQQTQLQDHAVSIETIHENLATLTTNTDNITGTVSSLETRVTQYESDTDYTIEEINNRISTMELTASEFSLTFDTYKSETDSRIGDTESWIEEYKTYITMSDNGIRIGKSDSEFNSLFSNDMLGFYYGEELKSYIDDEGLGVPNKANIGKECQIGEYAWVYDPDTQHLTLVIK